MSTGDETGREPGASGPGADAGPSTGGQSVSDTSATAGAGLVFDDPLDRPSGDDTDRSWGDSPSGTADDDFTRFLNEKPPHHL
jgi:acetyl-CoA synthetase